MGRWSPVPGAPVAAVLGSAQGADDDFRRGILQRNFAHSHLLDDYDIRVRHHAARDDDQAVDLLLRDGLEDLRADHELDTREQADAAGAADLMRRPVVDAYERAWIAPAGPQGAPGRVQIVQPPSMVTVWPVV